MKPFQKHFHFFSSYFSFFFLFKFFFTFADMLFLFCFGFYSFHLLMRDLIFFLYFYFFYLNVVENEIMPSLEMWYILWAQNEHIKFSYAHSYTFLYFVFMQNTRSNTLHRKMKIIFFERMKSRRTITFVRLEIQFLFLFFI